MLNVDCPVSFWLEVQTGLPVCEMYFLSSLIFFIWFKMNFYKLKIWG